jgi:dimethylhistidine N-methyltransferase
MSAAGGPERLLLQSLASGEGAAEAAAEAEELRRGLSVRPRSVPSRYFYDDRGSELFERICTLPEYYPTRTEETILAHNAPEIACLAGPSVLVELGSGSARKTRLLIETLLGAAPTVRPSLRYVPVDVSGGILRQSAEALLAAHAGLSVTGLIGTYEQAFPEISRRPWPEEGPLLVAFLGSTIGNFSPAETDRFLAALRAALRAGDRLLVGIDLRKDIDVLEAAYNDAAGVTAAFNRNMLLHLNRRFGADFVSERFRHRAFYNGEDHQIEMHLESLEAQSVKLAALGLEVRLDPGETIRTEISRKFDLDGFGADLAHNGFAVERSWRDARRWFGLVLAQAV